MKQLRVEPFPYQKEGIEFALRNRYSINAFNMGLGKTLVGIGFSLRSHAFMTLVICPKSLVLNWRHEIEKFSPNPKKFLVTSYSQLAKLKKDFRKFDCVILDEAHYVKSIQAKRTQLVHELVEKHRPHYFLLLSGTPVKNRIPEIWSLLRLVWLGGRYPQFDIYSNSIWSFQRTFTNEVLVRVGGRKISKFEGMKNIPQLKELLKPIYLRKRAEDVLLDLPEMVHTDLFQSDTASFDSELENAWESYSGGGDKSSFSSIKAVNALAKVPYTVEFVQDLVEQGERVIVFTDHKQSAREIADKIDTSTRCITGETSMEDRDTYVRGLNGGEFNCLVSTIGALSVGVNLTGVNYMVFNDFAWVEADMEQARKRIHRIGQKKTCFYYYVFSSKVDEYIYKTLKAKQKLVAEMDG